MSLSDDSPQRLSVMGILGNRFAKVMVLASPIVDGQVEMMRGYRCRHSVPQALDARHRCRRGDMLQHNP